MSKKQKDPILAYVIAFIVFVFTFAIAGNVLQHFGLLPTVDEVSSKPPDTRKPATKTTTQKENSSSLPNSIDEEITIRLAGSTSMVTINEAVKERLELDYPGTSVVATASGSTEGINDVVAGNVHVAASSRPLSTDESALGLKAIPVATDAIAFVVSKENPLSTGLTQDQARGIFRGEIQDWSLIQNSKSIRPIQVINRPAVSGTHQALRRERARAT